jgi:hypothetical protein
MTPIENHIDQALAKTIARFKNKPRFAAWCAAHLRRWQELESVFWDIIDSRDVDTCDETRLVLLGKIVGQARIGTLEQFRIYVKARISVNRSRGRVADVVKVARLLLGGVSYSEPSAHFIRISHPDALDLSVHDPNTIATLLRETKSAGVGLHLIYSGQAPANRMRFSYTSTASNPNQSFSYLAGGTGGKWAGLA